jgi:hypothetical protein
MVPGSTASEVAEHFVHFPVALLYPVLSDTTSPDAAGKCLQSTPITPSTTMNILPTLLSRLTRSHDLLNQVALRRDTREHTSGCRKCHYRHAPAPIYKFYGKFSARLPSRYIDGSKASWLACGFYVLYVHR